MEGEHAKVEMCFDNRARGVQKWGMKMTRASLMFMGLLCGSPAWADEAAVRAVAQKLPAQLAALYKAQEEKFAGSTMDMIAAADAVSSGILPALVALEMDGKSKAEKATFQKEIERDAEGIANEVYYRSNATGSGGTIVGIEAASSKTSYIETRICHAVTTHFGEDQTFDLESWQKEWAKAGGSVGGDGESMEAGEEDTEADGEEAGGLRIEENELKFAPGSTGGTFTAGEGELSGKTLKLNAKAGQQLLIASTNTKSRLLVLQPDGKKAPAAEWAGSHELILPESKGGRYLIEFPEKPRDPAQVVQLLVEIR